MSPVAADVASADSAPTAGAEPAVVVAGAAVAAGGLPELGLVLLDDPQPAIERRERRRREQDMRCTRCMSGILGI